MSGRFITIEGGDGAGKSTLIERLYQALSSSGADVVKTRAPGGTKIGEAIRELILHRRDCAIGSRCELFLYLADRAQHVEEVIAPALTAGKTVLCDRYNDSTLAYQGSARGLDETLVRSLCHAATQGLTPDLTLYLDLDPQLGRQRLQGSQDRIESEAPDFHARIRAAFLHAARCEPLRIRVLDASLPPDDVFRQAWSFLLDT
jgi:dTMP kinase